MSHDWWSADDNAAWRGDVHEKPVRWFSGSKMLDAEGEVWAKETLAERVRGAKGWAEGRIDIALQNGIIRWYQSHLGEFVWWRPSLSYETGKSNGVWNYSEAAFIKAWDRARDAAIQALKEAKADADAQRCRSLDEWLAADISGTLESKGTTGGSSSLPWKVRGPLMNQATGRRAAWPRNCIKCDEEFRPERFGVKNCLPCRRARVSGGASESARGHTS